MLIVCTLVFGYENEKERYVTMKTVCSYEEAVEYCLETPKFTKKNEMEVTRTFYMFMFKEKIAPCIIHVAGTNGKGSTCAFLQSICIEMRKKVGTFTSPHLCDIRERIRLNGEMIEKQDFYECFHELMLQLSNFREKKMEYAEYHPSFFELLFFVAMIYFNKKKLDTIILETGLGGRLDATNAIPNKDLCIITEIGFDHMEYLGETIEEIASEKAGIISKFTPVVFLNQSPEVKSVVEMTAKELSSESILVSKESATLMNNSDKDIDFSYNTRYYGYVRFLVRSKAIYQMENAMLAIAAAECLWNQEMDVAKLQNGIKNMHHEGRMEEVLPNVYLDGAHNEDGINAFLDTVKNDGLGKTGTNRKRHLLFSVVQDKQYEKMVKCIVDSKLFSTISIASIGNERGLSEEELSRVFSGCDCVKQYASVEGAIIKMLIDRDEQDLIYVAGSLYLVGQLKDYLRGIDLDSLEDKIKND